MRVLPNMTVIVPCDALEAKKATIASASYKGPVYIRLGRSGVPVITREEDDFQIGKADLLKDGKDVAIIACGVEVYEALCAAEALQKENISARVINLHTIKPIDRDIIIKAAKETGAVVTSEEHAIAGGMGSAVSEVLSQSFPVPMEFVGVKDRFGESGDPKELFKLFGLTAEDIVKAVKKVIQRKK
jgi:transketolase